MSSSAASDTNSLKAGIFVVISVALAVAVIFLVTGLAEAFGKSGTTWKASFPVEQGVDQLSSGAAVQLGGVKVGIVSEVIPVIEQGLPCTEIEVIFTLPDEISLYADASISVSASLIGGKSWLDVSSVGTVAAGPPGELGIPSRGGSPLGSVIGAKGAASLEHLLESMSQLATRLERNGEVLAWILGDSGKTQIERAVTDAAEAVTQFKDLSHQVNRDWDQWNGVIDEVVAQAPKISDAIDTIDRIVTTNEAPIGEAIGNFQSASDRADEILKRVQSVMVAQVENLLDTGNTAMVSANAAINDIRRSMPIWTEDISTTLANAAIASQRIKVAIAEIRASPWKLLYQPSSTEVTNTMLYEAARNFSFASADLKTAAESMDHLATVYAGPQDDQAIEMVRTNLLEAYDRFNRANNQLLDVLLKDEQK
jgi:ABC-type transporter Mla subunit MlaD